MLVVFKNSPFSDDIKDIYIQKDEKTIKIMFGGNGDLYIDIFGPKNTGPGGEIISIFKMNQDDEVYSYFEELIDNILNCRVYEINEMELEFCQTEEDKKNKIKYIEKINTELRINGNYSDLVRDNCITWYSDSIYNEKANSLRIKKENNDIILVFQDNLDDPTFGFGIRICNSGSKYQPFNVCFMKLFNQLNQNYKSQQQIENKELIKNGFN